MEEVLGKLKRYLLFDLLDAFPEVRLRDEGDLLQVVSGIPSG